MVQKPTTAAEVFSVGEIARVAGTSPAAVRELIARRRQMLESYLSGAAAPRRARRSTALARATTSRGLNGLQM